MKHMILAMLICTPIFGCSDDTGDNNTTNNTTGTTGTTGTNGTTGDNNNDDLTCTDIAPMNPTPVDLNNDDIVFDVDFPESFVELRMMTANDISTGFVAGRVLPGNTMVGFGYQFTQETASRVVSEAERMTTLENGFTTQFVVDWGGNLLDVYVADDPFENQSDAVVFLPAATDGEFHRLSVKTYIQNAIVCPGEISEAQTLFFGSLRPKGS